MKAVQELGIDVPWHVDGGDASDGARFRLFDDVAEAVRERAALEPLVLIFDDIHALDVSSAILMRYLIRYLREARVLLLSTYRDECAPFG